MNEYIRSLAIKGRYLMEFQCPEENEAALKAMSEAVDIINEIFEFWVL